jgi:hypothetical protein
VLDASRFTAALLEIIADPRIRQLPVVGAIDQYVDNTDAAGNIPFLRATARPPPDQYPTSDFASWPRWSPRPIRSIGRSAGEWPGFGWRPQQDSNLRTRLRRPLLYPLSYGGSDTARESTPAGPESGYQGAKIWGHGVDHYASARARR